MDHDINEPTEYVLLQIYHGTKEDPHTYSGYIVKSYNDRLRKDEKISDPDMIIYNDWRSTIGRLK